MKIDKKVPQDMNTQLQKLDGKLKQASEMYEKQFLRQMVQAMRQSVSHSALTKPGMAENIYREQMDDHYVDQWVERGGTGFADLVYNQLVDRFYPQLGAQKMKNIRPVDVTDRFQGFKKGTPDSQKNKMTFNIELKQAKSFSPSYLNVPWRGQFAKEFSTHDGHKVVSFQHDSGLQSTFAFKGQLLPGLLNKTLEAGENFALLSPETQNLTWQVLDENSRKDSPAL